MTEIGDLVWSVFGPPPGRRHKSEDLHLTLGQLECLRLIGELGSPSMSDLSGRLHLRPSSVTGMIDALARRGKVQRVEDTADRRVVRVQLTEAGQRDRQHHREARRERLRGLLGDLGEEELVNLYRALRTLQVAAIRRNRAEEADEVAASRP